MQQVNVKKEVYGGIKCSTVIPEPAYDMICELAVLLLRFFIRMGLEQLGKEDADGSDQTDPETAGVAP